MGGQSAAAVTIHEVHKVKCEVVPCQADKIRPVRAMCNRSRMFKTPAESFLDTSTRSRRERRM